MRGLITAIRTLTLIPVPGKDAEKMSDSLPFFPVIGAVIGAVVSVVAWAVAGKCGWPAGAGVLCVAVSSFLTRGIHLDGLADVFDSLGGQTPQRRLAIMKDPRIGSFGVIALVIVLAMKAVAVARLAGAGSYMMLVVPFVVSRMMQVHLLSTLPYARVEGGTGQKFVEGASMYHFLVAYTVGLLLCFAIGRTQAVVIAITACLFCSVLAGWMRRTFGGVTGDLAGMGSELSETGTLLALALLGS